ncbi:MAG: hypothetical protein ACYC5H_16830 [Methylovirgula sp.]
MSAVKFDDRRVLHLAVSVLAGLLILVGSHREVRAARPTGHTFILPDSSGYGVSDCRGKAEGCSEVVASAWCEAHGYAAPLAYGTAQDVTGTSPGAQPVQLDPDDFIVTCGD